MDCRKINSVFKATLFATAKPRTCSAFLSGLPGFPAPPQLQPYLLRSVWPILFYSPQTRSTSFVCSSQPLSLSPFSGIQANRQPKKHTASCQPPSSPFLSRPKSPKNPNLGKAWKWNTRCPWQVPAARQAYFLQAKPQLSSRAKANNQLNLQPLQM